MGSDLPSTVPLGAAPLSDAGAREVPVRPYDLEDELVAAVRQDGIARVKVYIPHETAVVLGRGSRLESEVNLDAVLRDSVPLYRRRGGGCAVVLDEGNVVVAAAFVTSGGLHVKRDFAGISDWVIEGLARAGVDHVQRLETSDLAVGAAKIGGACMHRSGKLITYSTTLMVNPRVDLMDRYLKHPPREPAYRRGRNHTDFVSGLGQFVAGLTPAGLLSGLLENLDGGMLASRVADLGERTVS